ncbi:MAG: membrane protein insertion efficiency factor YidD [Spirochaetia bacterium]
MSLGKWSLGSIFLLAFTLGSPFPAPAEDPYEPGERTPVLLSSVRPGPSAMEWLFGFYQDVLEYNTIHRCPFYTTCSYFAKEQVEKRGFILGTLFFIDRYIYRENMAAFFLYPLKQNKDGIYKLNDDYFLEN